MQPRPRNLKRIELTLLLSAFSKPSRKCKRPLTVLPRQFGIQWLYSSGVLESLLRESSRPTVLSFWYIRSISSSSSWLTIRTGGSAAG